MSFPALELFPVRKFFLVFCLLVILFNNIFQVGTR